MRNAECDFFIEPTPLKREHENNTRTMFDAAQNSFQQHHTVPAAFTSTDQNEFMIEPTPLREDRVPDIIIMDNYLVEEPLSMMETVPPFLLICPVVS
jgi:hypothetical protein